MKGNAPVITEAAFVELRVIAARLMRRERSCHTLQPTELVAEAFLKVRNMLERVETERHLFGVCCRAMQQVLIDRARVRNGRKRLMPLVLTTLREETVKTSPEARMAVLGALEELGKRKPLVAETLSLRFLEGLTVVELEKRQQRAQWRIRGDLEYGLYEMEKLMRRRAGKR